MSEPPLGHPFDPDDVSFDPPVPPISLFESAYYPAKIVVKPIAANHDLKDDQYFKQNIAEPTDIPWARTEAIDKIQDVDGDIMLWVMHLIGGYEGDVSLDYDGENSFLLGRAIDGSNKAYLYMETIRDRAGVNGAVDEQRLKNRIALHESGHLMGVGHTPDTSVMNIDTNVTGSDGENRFVNWQLGRIQAQPEPYVVAPPTGP